MKIKDYTKDDIKDLSNIQLILTYTKEIMRLELLHKHKEYKDIIKRNIDILGNELLSRLERTEN
jgi:uncharacterized protein with HEPN domain